MTATLKISDNASLNRSVTVGFKTHKEAQTFMRNYTYYGGILTFNIDYVDFNYKRSVKNVSSSDELFETVHECLLNSKYSWANYIIMGSNKKLCLLDNLEYPNQAGYIVLK